MMRLRSRLRTLTRPSLKRFPSVWNGLIGADRRIERLRHSAAAVLPLLIRPEPRNLEVAITGQCNLSCVGCRYGRDFMVGSQLSWPVVRDLLDDAKELGFHDVRFYGGEPLLHPHLPRMISHASGLGLESYVTTNGVLLRQKIQALYKAGLRTVNIGFYGTGAKYDAYVQHAERFQQLELGVADLRERYGMDVQLRINWLLMRPSCSVDALHRAFAFAQRFQTMFQVDLIHYSLPYFTEGPDRMLQFRPEDLPAIKEVVGELLRLRETYAEHFNQSVIGLRSIPDWLLKRAEMKVPCDSHQMIWIGPDGTVQQCYVTFKLGNLHQQRLRELLFTPDHYRYSRDSFALNCPNCHCHYEVRIRKHGESIAHYSKPSVVSITRI